MMPSHPSGSAARRARLPGRRSLLLPAAALLVFGVTGSGASEHARLLTFEDRVRAQEAIERAAYSHRIGATKPFEEVMPRRLLEEKVRRSLKLSVALETIWNAPVTSQMLDAEVGRLARRTRMPERLEEIEAVLGNDPLLFEECYARQFVVERLARDRFANDAGIQAEAPDITWDDWWRDTGAHLDGAEARQVVRTAVRPAIAASRIVESSTDPEGSWAPEPWPDARQWHTAVWTGTEMIVWGGFNGTNGGAELNTGGRYDPATERWTPTSTLNAPALRQLHTAVWTGTQCAGGARVSHRRVDRDGDDRLGRRPVRGPDPLRFRRPVQPGHRLLVSDVEHQRSGGALLAHGCLGGDDDDRLGR